MKKLFVIIVSLVMVMAWMASPYAATQDDFTLTILKDGNPMREFSGEVAIPFDTEYKLRLKNNNQRRCSATVWIDGAKVSEMGSFIINGNDLLDLERFLNDSLTKGMRFKFVPLDHPDIDDPNRAENGIIKVEFRLEKDWYIIELPNFYGHLDHQAGGLNDGDMDYYFNDDGMLVILLNDNNTINTLDFNHDLLIGTDASTSILCSNTSAGATVPGSYSSQAFHKVDFDGGDEIVTIQLRMVGL